MRFVKRPTVENAENLTLMGQILASRGVENVEDFFNLTWDCVQEPTGLDYVLQAATRIIRAMNDNEKIALLVDCDADGFTSAALLKNYLAQQTLPYASFPDSTAEIIPLFHSGKIHGLGDVKIMRALRDEIKPTLLIVPDASGTAEQYQALINIGIDVVVIDHHDMVERGDGEHVIVVNNQQSKNYRNKSLSGVGVTWQVCREMDDLLPFCCADQYLDLVAIGLVSDVMDMRSNETRFLIKEGLKPENMRCPLCVKADQMFTRFDGMTIHFIGWTLGPGINAIARIGTQAENAAGFGCFLEENMDKMVPNNKRGCTGDTEFVREAWRLVTNTKGRQDRRRNKLTTLVQNLIDEEGLTNDKVIVVAVDDYEEEYKALTGVVCNSLIDVYQRPVVLAFKDNDGNYTGSLRAPGHVDAWANFKDLCLKSKYCKYVAGHQLAAGICIYGDSIVDFIDYFNNLFADIDTEEKHIVDFIFDPADPAIADLCADVDAAGDTWGNGVEEPLIAIKGVRVGAGTIDIVGKQSKTLRIALPNGVTCVKFRSSNEEYESLSLPYTNPQQFYLVDIVGTPKVNHYQGYDNPQIEIVDYEVKGVVCDF